MRRVISLSLIASSMMFGHTFVFNIDSLDNIDEIKSKLESIVSTIDSMNLDRKALSPLVGGNSDINDTVEDGVGYVIFYPYNRVDTSKYNDVVKRCIEDSNFYSHVIPSVTVECGDGEYYDGSSCQPIPPADNTCENGYGGDPYDGGIYCGYKGLTSLSPGWLNLKSCNDILEIYRNSLTDISNLSNLTLSHDLLLDGNSLTSLHGLENLGRIDSWLNLKSNSNLTNISALNNITYVGKLLIDEREYSGKLDSNSYICQNFEDKVYRDSSNKWDPSHKSWICE